MRSRRGPPRRLSAIARPLIAAAGPQEQLEEPVELGLAREGRCAGRPPCPGGWISTRVPRAARSRSSAARVLASLRGPSGSAGARSERHPALHLADRESLAGGFAGEGDLVFGPLQREERPGVPRVEAARRRGAPAPPWAGAAGAGRWRPWSGPGPPCARPPPGSGGSPRCSRWKAWASSSGLSSSRWMFSTRASSRSWSSATSRTVTGTVARPSLLGGAPAPLAGDDLVAAPPSAAPGSAGPCRSRGSRPPAPRAAPGSIARPGLEGIGVEAGRSGPRVVVPARSAPRVREQGRRRLAQRLSLSVRAHRAANRVAGHGPSPPWRGPGRPRRPCDRMS